MVQGLDENDFDLNKHHKHMKLFLKGICIVAHNICGISPDFKEALPTAGQKPFNVDIERWLIREGKAE